MYKRTFTTIIVSISYQIATKRNIIDLLLIFLSQKFAKELFFSSITNQKINYPIRIISLIQFHSFLSFYFSYFCLKLLPHYSNLLLVFLNLVH